jgi:hypothetical protein
MVINQIIYSRVILKIMKIKNDNKYYNESKYVVNHKDENKKNKIKKLII